MRQQPNNYDYEVSDALPMSEISGIKEEVEEGLKRFEAKQANKKPTWKWVEDKPKTNE
tara:strand:- start:1431 stop:1604 length:174 start_codon:yes stop_codon:yes gene_type:complete